MRKKAMLWEVLPGGKVHCFLCAHNCQIAKDDYGYCGMRQNIDGELWTHAYANVIASHIDPIEKKPLYHFLPGTDSYSIATIGCNFRCSFCQNWRISQQSVKDFAGEGYELKPEEVVREAVRNECDSISYTYTEPTVFFEYAYDTARLAREKGIKNIFVTNGFMTEKAIETISPFLDAANVDLKFFSEASYRNICKGSLQPVLDSIRKLKENDVWVEVTTLVVPGVNDSEDELTEIARFIAGVSKDIPWHISRFHPDYNYTDAAPTPVDTMEMAGEKGKASGLKYVYLGNIMTAGETFCPECSFVLISREGFTARFDKDFTETGTCPKCGGSIAGVWK